MYELVDKAKLGDLQAYGMLIERYERTVFASVYSILADVHAAEDVTQDVFILGYQKITLLRDSFRFPQWLLKIARREAVRAAKQYRRRQALPITNAVDPPATYSESLQISGDMEYLLRQVQRLPLHEQLVVSLRFFDEHTVREISEMTGCPVGTVTKRLSRAIGRLRNFLKSEAL